MPKSSLGKSKQLEIRQGHIGTSHMAMPKAAKLKGAKMSQIGGGQGGKPGGHL